MDYRENYSRWLSFAECETNLEEKEIEDRFYKELEFGTGGLRGIMAAGTNRINEYTIAKASQGLANYIGNGGSVVISYDSRRNSEQYAKVAAQVFSSNKIKVLLFEEMMPTPVLSYATRYYKCSAGVMITASHNPAEYNGYKVYGSDGCQITTEIAKAIQEEIDKVEISSVEKTQLDDGKENEHITLIGKEVYENFIKEVRKKSLAKDRDIKIVYTPLNGTGLKPVIRILKEDDFEQVQLVEEQTTTEGDFKTCPKPNPEEKEALALGIQKLKEIDADILIATDPDCDRVGVAIREESTERILTGNQLGALLIDFICKENALQQKSAIIKTIVTNELGAKIAEENGAKVFSVLTGFKFIGERIGQFEKNKDYNFVFGYEESYGFLVGTHARDKDAVVASMLICEMTAYWKARGKTLIKRLNELYAEYGYHLDALDSFAFEGKTGSEKISEIMTKLRSDNDLFLGKKIDYLTPQNAEEGYGKLPATNVIKYILDDGSWIAIRPSGTEPKLKIYYGINAEDETTAKEKLERYKNKCKEIIKE